MATLAGLTPLVVHCQEPSLWGEVGQRIGSTPESDQAAGALWIEPRVADWPATLARLTTSLTPRGTLAIVASRPLARLLPERRGEVMIQSPLLGKRANAEPPGATVTAALGLTPGGIGRLRSALERSGHAVEEYGIHAVAAIARNLLAQQVERRGRPELGDRLHFAARGCYCWRGPFAPLSTVALLVARKGEDRCD